MPQDLVERIAPELAALVEPFLSGSRRDAALLAEALGKGDLVTAERIGHNAKGAGAAYGFVGLRDLGRRLEQAAGAGDMAAAMALLEEFREYVERVRVEFV